MSRLSRRCIFAAFSSFFLCAVALPLPIHASVPLQTKTISSITPLPFREPVQTGLDVLEEENFRRLEGRHVGIVCNVTAVDREGQHIVDLMRRNSRVHIVALFGPEHGIRGNFDDWISDSIDPRTGLKVYSLYNERVPRAERYRPTSRMLKGIDTLVFDIQDIGIRYYTYIATLGYTMEEAARRGIKVIVLDRPNPLGGMMVEGPDLDMSFRSLAGYHNIPITHGMTVGELAILFNQERRIGADLEVVKMRNWTRDLLFDETGLPWINPSPNIRNLHEAMLYAGVGILEDLPVSVGRGTHTPFEVVGAPWINGRALAKKLNARHLCGVYFEPTNFRPLSDTNEGKTCYGVRIVLCDCRTCRPSSLGIHIADALARLYPSRFNRSVLSRMDTMVGTQAIPDDLARGVRPSAIIASWSRDVAHWRERRTPYLLYS